MGLRVLLNENVAELGGVGDLVEVADGYARNFLFPRNLAVPATSRNVKEFEHTKRLIALKREKAAKSAQDLVKQLSKVSITIAKQVGEEDKLFGSVTNRDIEDALAKQGVQVDRRNIALGQPIKSLGVYDVKVKLHAEVTTEIKVFVVAE